MDGALPDLFREQEHVTPLVDLEMEEFLLQEDLADQQD
jgi:cytochrome c-type biogenesis protein CcmE